MYHGKINAMVFWTFKYVKIGQYDLFHEVIFHPNTIYCTIMVSSFYVFPLISFTNVQQHLVQLQTYIQNTRLAQRLSFDKQLSVAQIKFYNIYYGQCERRIKFSNYLHSTQKKERTSISYVPFAYAHLTTIRYGNAHLFVSHTFFFSYSPFPTLPPLQY